MKNTLHSLIILCALVLFSGQHAWAQCSASASSDATIPCGGSYAMAAQTNAVVYSVTASACAPLGTGGTNPFPTACDDCVTGQIPLGFNFNFYGNVYNSAVIQSNGILGFGPFTFTGYSPFAIPSGGNPNNYIAGFFADIDIRNGGNIRYQTTGVAPNREFVVSYNNVATYGPGTGTVSFQIILHENGSFRVVISQLSANWNATTSGALATSGAENIDGTLAFPVPGRNSTDWPGISPLDLDCHIFNPQPCVFQNWTLGGSVVSTNPNYTVSPATTTTYTAHWNCGGTPCSDDVVVTVPTAPTGTGTTICQGGSGTLTSSFACAPTGSIINQNTVFNSGTLATSDPRWNRNGGGTTCTATAGTNNYYDVFSFTVSTAGSYTFNGCAATMDAHASLYQNAFNGANPCGTPANFIIGNDDGNGANCGLDPRITATLSPGITYFLITTTFGSGTTGNYDWTYTGPGGATITTGGGPPGVYEWYTTPTGGTAIGTGSPFNPVGVAGSGLPNTNTPGTTSYYLACSNSPACRTQIDFVINSASTPPNITPMPGSYCPDVSLTLNASGGVAGLGSTIRWYAGPNGTGGLLGTGNSINVTTPNTTTNYYVRREGTCNNSADDVITITVKDFIYGLNGATTTTYCTDNSGWHHFFNGNEILLSIQGDVTGAAPGFPQIAINDNGSFFQQTEGPGSAPGCAGGGLTPGEERFEMERSWDVDFGVGGVFNPPYNVRFYYQAAERTAIETAAANWISTYGACAYTYKYGNPLGFYWFKNAAGTYTAPDYDGLHLAGANGTTANGINYVELTGLTSFSGGTGGIILDPTALLSVDWLSFEGETEDNKVNHLRWATASEANSTHFNVLRSQDGINFEKIGTVAAAGASTTTKYYTFDDEHPFTGANYYRIELVDGNAGVEYTNTILLVIEDDGKGYTFYPNPTVDIVFYQYESAQKESLKIEINDVLGRTLNTVDMTSKVGINKIPVSLENYPIGSYIVKVHNENTGTVHTSKIIKTKL